MVSTRRPFSYIPTASCFFVTRLMPCSTLPVSLKSVPLGGSPAPPGARSMCDDYSKNPFASQANPCLEADIPCLPTGNQKHLENVAGGARPGPGRFDLYIRALPS